MSANDLTFTFKCHFYLNLSHTKMTEKVSNLNEYEAKLSEAGNKLVVVDLYASYCGACKMIEHRLETLAREFTNVLFLKVDIDEIEDLAQRYNVNLTPTFIFIKENNVITHFAGANYDKLRNTVEHNK